MSQKKCPGCPFQYDTAKTHTYKECSNCGARFCTNCSGRLSWKCPVCKSPFGRLENP